MTSGSTLHASMNKKQQAALALAALGVAWRYRYEPDPMKGSLCRDHPIPLTPENILGVLSPHPGR